MVFNFRRKSKNLEKVENSEILRREEEKNPRSRVWGFTWNNHTKQDFEQIKEFAKIHCQLYTIQEETGESGNHHLQGFLKFKHQKGFNSLKSLFPKISFRISKKPEFMEAYCRKQETRTGELFTNNSKIVEDPLQGLKPFQWQKEILDLYQTKPDKRSVYWYYDGIGGTGKSTIVTHLCLKYPKNVFATSGKPADIKYGVRIFHEKFENNLKMCIFDIPRELKDKVSYEAIEDIKNGRFYSPKYESGMVILNSPHVLVFSNFEPKLEALSKDRWKIKNIEE